MKFPKTTLRLVSKRTFEKDGKTLRFVKLAEKATYDSNEFMPTRDTIFEALQEGHDYDVELNIEGRYTTVALTPAATQPKAG